MNKDLRALAILGIMVVLVATMSSVVAVLASPVDSATSAGLAFQNAEPLTRISIGGGRIAHGGTLALDLVGDTFPNGLTGYIIRVSTGDPSIAVPLQFTFPDFGLTDLDATSTPGSLGGTIVDLRGLIEVGAGDALLGTITFLAKAEGITAIHLDVERMDGEDGFPIITSVSAGILTVSNSRDLDGDGITEDINGNGVFDFADIVKLFRMILSPPSQ